MFSLGWNDHGLQYSIGHTDAPVTINVIKYGIVYACIDGNHVLLYKSGCAQFLPWSWYGVFHDSDRVLRQVRYCLIPDMGYYTIIVCMKCV